MIPVPNIFRCLRSVRKLWSCGKAVRSYGAIWDWHRSLPHRSFRVATGNKLHSQLISQSLRLPMQRLRQLSFRCSSRPCTGLLLLSLPATTTRPPLRVSPLSSNSRSISTGPLTWTSSGDSRPSAATPLTRTLPPFPQLPSPPPLLRRALPHRWTVAPAPCSCSAPNSAFGQTVASTGSSTSAYQFGATSGYRAEGDAGLTLVGCRFYDAQVGRFISRDTYLNQKPYAYCDGDPVNVTDPSGHGPDYGAGGVLLGAVAILVAIVLFPEWAAVTGTVAIVIGIGAIISGVVGSIAGNDFSDSAFNPPGQEGLPAPTQKEINTQKLRAEEYKASGGVIDF